MKKTLLMLGFVGLASFAMADPACTSTILYDATDPTLTTINPTGEFSGGASGCMLANYDYSNFQITPGAGYTGSTTVSVSFQLDASAPGGFYFSVAQGAGMDIDINYEISPGVTGMVLSLNIPGVASEVGTVNEKVCAGTTSCDSLLASGSVTTANPTVTISPITFATSDFISKDISQASGVFQQPSSVPEPMTFSLMGAGLLGLGFLGRRRVRK